MPAPLTDVQDISFKIPVEKYQLKNGLTVLLNPDHRIPHIYHLLIMKVGSLNEVEGKTGLAHLFEHLMFRGTKNFPGEKYDQKLNAAGAVNNAFTGRDFTGYLVDFPKEHLKMVLNLEADRLQNLIINKSIFEKELEVVKEERRLGTDNNPNDFFEPLMKLVYPRHPYGRPIVGWMKDLEKMKTPELETFYQTYYTPQNAVLVLAGDFNPSEAKKLIQKYYGRLKPPLHSPPRLAHLNKKSSAPKKIPRLAQYKRAVQGPTAALAWRAPKAGSPASYSLDILSNILTGGKSSRLQKKLVYNKRLALSVSSFYYGLRQKGMFCIAARLAPGAKAQTVKNIIFKEIKNLMLKAPSQKELLKSKRAVMHHFIAGLKNLEGKAYLLGESEVLFGDYREFLKDLKRYQSAAAQEVQKAAQLYLQTEKSFLVDLKPMETKPAKLKKTVSSNRQVPMGRRL